MYDINSLSGNDLSLYNRITDILLRIGIPPCAKGFEYLRCGIMLTYHTPNATELVTKTLYPSIARICRAESVEGIGRGCQRAIEFAFESPAVREFFGTDKPPRCAVFISAAADYLHKTGAIDALEK